MRRLLTAGIALALLVVLSPTAAAAPRLVCGATITKSTKLKADLTCPTGTALQVVPDGAAVVLDLGGHKVRGSGSGTGIVISGSSDPDAPVIVRHGSVKGFATGIAVSYAPGSRVKDVSVTGPGRTEAGSIGVRVRTSPDWLLDDVTVKGFATGVLLDAAHDGLLRDSTLSGNGTGAYLSPSVFRLTVQDSRILSNDQGLELSQSSMTLLHSEVARNGTGISLFQSGATVRDSTIKDNDTGVWGNSYGSGFTLADSTVRGNGVGVQLVRFGLRGPDNAIEGSTIKDNDGPGLVVDLVDGERTPALRIEHNRFLDNGDTPSDVGVPDVADQGAAVRVAENGGSVVVADNQARRNGGIGIDVVGATDGGDNTARGNDGSVQCRGVVCRR